MPVASHTEQLRIEGLNATANALIRVGTKANALTTIMEEDIRRLQQESGRRVFFRDGSNDGLWFSFTAVSPLTQSDYVRITKPNTVRLLSAKLDGIVISANLFKPDKYNHDNIAVAKALRRLADLIEKAPVRLADHDTELLSGR